MGAILSLDIGGTKLAASVLTRDGELLAKQRDRSPASRGPDAVVSRLVELAHGAIDSAGAPIAGVGISAGGPLDPVAGTVDNPPNLPGWNNVPLRSLVSRALGIAERRVAMENDANAGALAELHFGAARDIRDAIFLTMSTGIGGGLILDGRLYRGAGYNAGEVGHQIVQPDGPRCGCGNIGCLEAVASGAGIAARLRAEFDSLPDAIRRLAGSAEAIEARHLIDAAHAGEPRAVELLREIATLLGRGVSNLVFILNPRRVILGTIAHHAGDLLLVPLRAEVRRLCWPALTKSLEIVATSLGTRLEELSGLAVALEAENADNR